jgi:hypothetical protein
MSFSIRCRSLQRSRPWWQMSGIAATGSRLAIGGTAPASNLGRYDHRTGLAGFRAGNSNRTQWIFWRGLISRNQFKFSTFPICFRSEEMISFTLKLISGSTCPSLVTTRKGAKIEVWDSALGSLQKFFELLGAHTFLGKCAPFDAGCADRTGIQMPALFALGLWLISPYLDLLSALLAADILGLGSSNLCASWATFFKHVDSVLLAKKQFYDSRHIRRYFIP